MTVISTSGATKDRTQVALTARGLIAETVPFSSQTTTMAPNTSTAYSALLGLRAGDLVTNVVVYMSTNGTGLTLTKLALWSKAGTLLGASADASATFNSAGNNGTFISLPLTVAYPVPADDGYMVGIVNVGTTPATIHRGNSVVGAGLAIGGGVREAATAATQTDAASVTWAAVSSVLWAGVN